MSYDISFINKRPDQSWHEATAANEQRVLSQRHLRRQPVDEAVRSGWNLIVARLLAVHAAFVRFDGPRHLELTDRDLGLQVSLYPEEVAISLAYWHSGSAATKAFSLARQLAVVIADETGLSPYDGQQDRGFLEHADVLERAGREMTRVSATLHDVARASESGTPNPMTRGAVGFAVARDDYPALYAASPEDLPPTFEEFQARTMEKAKAQNLPVDWIQVDTAEFLGWCKTSTRPPDKKARFAYLVQLMAARARR